MRVTGVVGVLGMLLVGPGALSGQGSGDAGDYRAASAEPLPSAEPWEAPPLHLGRFEGEFHLDGRPDEPGWASVDPLPMVQHWPEFGGGMSERTEIRIAYDDDYLYAAGWFYTDDPSQISGNSLRRDRWEGDDAFDLIVDSYNDDQTALKFTTTPLGIQLDESIRNDARFADGQMPLNADWNTHWDAATTRTEEGWFAEMRIPLSSLGFSVDEGVAVMGLIAQRYIARKDERHIFPAIPPNWDMAQYMPSRARDVALEGVSAKRAFWLTPYALTGVNRVREPTATPVVAPQSDVPTEVGLDVKYGLSSNLTLDLTLNTDFAQVEADALQANLDRFGLFFPEKRQFFQERASAFDFDFGEGRLFHSRRIGLSEDGTPSRILGGARLAGRVGAWDVGALSMQVAESGGVPGENDGAFRVRRAFDRSQHVGGMLTTRIRNDGRTDLAGGVDGAVAFGREIVSAQLSHSRNAGGIGGDAGATQGTAARVIWERRQLDGVSYFVDGIYSGEGYAPALGFASRSDFSAIKGRLQYSWQPDASSPFTRVALLTAVRGYRRNADGKLETGLVRLRGWATLRGGPWFNVALNLTREDVARGFELPGAGVAAGRYDGWDLFLRGALSEASTLGAGLTLWGGTVFDGWRTTATSDWWWRPSRHFSVGGLLSYNRLRFPDRDQEVNADMLQLRASVALNTRLSAETFVQYSAARRAVGTNLRVRYRFAEGRDLYIVLDEGRDLEDRFGLDQALLGRTDRRLLVKYTYAFQR